MASAMENGANFRQAASQFAVTVSNLFKVQPGQDPRSGKTKRTSGWSTLGLEFKVPIFLSSKFSL